MARDKQTIGNIDNSDLTNYPNGRIKNNTGASDGTPVNEIVYGDLHEFFAKAMRLAGITYNGLPDNETNGYQLIEALKHLPSKNDLRYDLGTSGSSFTIALKISKLTVGEVFDAVATSNRGSETTISSTIGDTTVKSVTVIGDFLSGENLKIVNFASSVVIIRQVDSANIDTVVSTLNYLKKASQAQEDAGTSDSVATTPLVNKTTFTKRVNGTLSNPFLASGSQNGLMSSADKTKLDGLGGSTDKYGTILLGNTGAGPVGKSFTTTGNISSANLNSITSNGSVIQTNLDSAMSSSNFEVAVTIESLGNIDLDNDLLAPIWKRISNSVIQIHIQKVGNVTQNLKLHVTLTQR